MTESPYIAPRLTLRVGVTGHRPNKLGGVDTSMLQQRACSILDSLALTTRSIQAENDAADSEALYAAGTPELRLATAIAEGADRIVAEAAVQEGFGLNLILPFPKAEYAKDFEGDALEEYRKFLAHESVRSCTELDSGNRPDHRDESYLEAGQLMLAHSDVLIAVWDGQSAAGRGGTAEILLSRASARPCHSADNVGGRGKVVERTGR